MHVDRTPTLPPQLPAKDVDVTVIDQFMKLSPTERLELHDQWLAAIAELRAAFDKSQPSTEHG